MPSPNTNPNTNPDTSPDIVTTKTDPDQAAMVARAVQHAVEPLMERIDAMDARMRVTDVLSGLFLIIGLAGIGLYLRARLSGGKS